MLNQWQFRYLEWTIEKMNELSPMVNPTSFIYFRLKKKGIYF